jgi:hypothetical protein
MNGWDIAYLDPILQLYFATCIDADMFQSLSCEIIILSAGLQHPQDL